MDPEGATRRPGWRWALWLAYFAAWTAALLVPKPQAVMPDWDWTTSHSFEIAKTLHVAAYALLAALGGWVRAPCRFRWILVFVIMAHAAVTELLQLLVEGRNGSLRDVGLDHLGIGLGLLLTWKWWSDPA